MRLGQKKKKESRVLPCHGYCWKMSILFRGINIIRHLRKQAIGPFLYALRQLSVETTGQQSEALDGSWWNQNSATQWLALWLMQGGVTARLQLGDLGKDNTKWHKWDRVQGLRLS